MLMQIEKKTMKENSVLWNIEYLIVMHGNSKLVIEF